MRTKRPRARYGVSLACTVGLVLGIGCLPTAAQKSASQPADRERGAALPIKPNSTIRLRADFPGDNEVRPAPGETLLMRVEVRSGVALSAARLLIATDAGLAASSASLATAIGAVGPDRPWVGDIELVALESGRRVVSLFVTAESPSGPVAQSLAVPVHVAGGESAPVAEKTPAVESAPRGLRRLPAEETVR